MTERLVHPFDPVYDASSRVLILGSFPSVISRQQSFYYANKNNRFWPVLSSLFEEEIPAANEDRKRFCLAHHIALWDVIHACSIKGSSDASITDAEANDIASLLKKTKISIIFTTGKKASDLYDQYINVPLPKIALPSTSSANARMRLPDLKEAYSIIKEYV